MRSSFFFIQRDRSIEKDLSFQLLANPFECYPKKQLTRRVLLWYFLLVVAAMLTPCPLEFFRSRNSISRRAFPNSHGIISFADPHLITPVRSYRYKNHRGRGAAPNLRTCEPSNLPTRSIPLSPLSATLTRIPVSVDSKGLTGKLSSLDATLTKNTGVGAILQAKVFFQCLHISSLVGVCCFQC